MTSELKPCPFCGGRAERIEVHEDDDFENRGGAAIECQQCLASSHVEFGRMENLVSSWNTRATPSADTLAGLVRFGWNSEDQIVDPMEDGEYALHSEAAKIIAAKDAEIEKLKRQTKTAEDFLYEVSRKLGNAEAELAQIKAQEPVMWLCVHDDRGSDRAITTPSPSRRDILKADGYEITPLYASPLVPEGGNN